ncbi:bifunctional cytidylate kinase/GTPase Der [Micrococcoides hystricis]|uniref:Multifunctional fusion protein n=1 Tax=Micrococcoides hystricis TaxID=1572761 RepID=A0ABV6P6N5_9MICC
MTEENLAEHLVIAIDGPSGSGKSSVSKAVARALDAAYLDTGAMYRAVAWLCLDQELDTANEEAVLEGLRDAEFSISTDPDDEAVEVNSNLITEAIRSTEVTSVVSEIAAHLQVRAFLVQAQQEIIAEHPAIVVEGRDITTVVAPDAPVRILLTADEATRMSRRGLQIVEQTDQLPDQELLREQVKDRDAKDAQVNEFMVAADGVVTVDSTDLNFEETVEAVLAVVNEQLSNSAQRVELEDESDHKRAQILREHLGDYELEPEDEVLLADWEDDLELVPEKIPPVLAVVGRPNVGKSTLVNRILGRREAVVEDVPGVTRDRVSYPAEWNGREFTMVDTGGWEQDAKGIHRRVAEQAEMAVDVADAVLFVVDATVGATATDEAVVRMLRRKKKPIILAANKIDDFHQEPEAAALWGLGLGTPYPVSAIHGRGTADLLDAVMEELPEQSAYGGLVPTGGPRRVALIGRPNVGKSSLLNKLAGEERVVVDDIAGTTRDPVDELVELGDQTWRFVDTAGIRRRQHMAHGAEYYASLRTQTALDRAEVAVVLIAADQVISEQDVRIVQLALDSGRALVLAINKWDLLDDERRKFLEREIEQDLSFVDWAPRVNISAATGWHKDKLVPALETALESWDKRLPTAKLNAFLGELVAAHPHPVRGGKQPRILFGTQVSARPPKFVLFTTGFLDPQYRRFITRRLRETFGFKGTPIEIGMRVRERRSRND